MTKKKESKRKAVSTPSKKGTKTPTSKAVQKKRKMVGSQQKAKAEQVPTDAELLTQDIMFTTEEADNASRNKAKTAERLRLEFREFMDGEAFPQIRHYKKRASLWALQKTYGLVKPASKMVRFDRASYYNWRNDDPDYYQATEQLQEDLLDLAQSKLTERVNGVRVAKGDDVYELPPDVTAILAVLNNLGKKRGFNAPVEVHHLGGTKVLIPNAQ